MGLDTVELVVAFEKHFQLEIPDPVVERMFSVNDVVLWVSQQLSIIGQRPSAVRVNVSKLLQHLLLAEEANDDAEAEGKLLTDLLPNRQAYQRAASRLQAGHGLCLLTLDFMPAIAGGNWLRRLFGSVELQANAPSYRLSHLIDWTVAFNYEKLLKLPLASQYEVEQAVIGITADKSGVAIPEIKLSSRFTYELGMD